MALNQAIALPCLLFFHLLLVLPLHVHAKSKVTSIIVFGDSSVDTGNNNQISTIAKSDFEPYGRDFADGQPTGRFSNGRVATDFLSEFLGLKSAIPPYLDPTYDISDFVDGVCFASAATGYDNVTSDVLNVLPPWKQLEYFKSYQGRLRSYLGVQKANWILSEALYVISFGTNDFLENYYAIPTRSSQYKIGEYEDFLVGIAENFVKQIYNLGARKISVGGVPPMGCMPLERSVNYMSGSGCVEKYNIVAREFNGKLQASLAKLSGQLAGIRLVYSNVYDPMLQVINRPSAFGFEDVATGCCASGTFEMGYLCDRNNPLTCTDASKYVFWDSFHPTERTNLIVAAHVLKTSMAQFSKY